jgi:hypothetical protein
VCYTSLVEGYRSFLVSSIEPRISGQMAVPLDKVRQAWNAGFCVVPARG